MRKISVLEVIDRSFLGGGQINLLYLAKNLDREKFEVSVCSQNQGPLVDEVKKLGINHYPVSFSKKIDLKIVNELGEILKNQRIDILHSHGGVAGLYGRWAARKYGVPVIVHTLHGIHYLNYRIPFLKYFYIALEKKYSGFTDALVFVSDEDRDEGAAYRLAPGTKMTVIKNGIDFLKCMPGKNRKEIKMGNLFL